MENKTEVSFSSRLSSILLAGRRFPSARHGSTEQEFFHLGVHVSVEHSSIVSRLSPSQPLVDDLYRAHYSSLGPYHLSQLLSAPAYPAVSNSPVDRAPQHISRELALRNGFWSDSQFENPSSPEGLVVHRSRADERRLAGAQSLRGRSCSAVVNHCRHLGEEPVMWCRVDHTHVVRHV